MGFKRVDDIVPFEPLNTGGLNDSLFIDAVCSPEQGYERYERIGREIKLQKLLVKVNISRNPNTYTGSTTTGWYRMAIVFDKQANSEYYSGPYPQDWWVIEAGSAFPSVPNIKGFLRSSLEGRMEVLYDRTWEFDWQLGGATTGSTIYSTNFNNQSAKSLEFEVDLSDPKFYQKFTTDGGFTCTYGQLYVVQGSENMYNNVTFEGMMESHVSLSLRYVDV